MTNVFFDTFINLEKYLEYEQRDPFSNMRDLDGPELSDWEKYAADEYENDDDAVEIIQVKKEKGPSPPIPPSFDRRKYLKDKQEDDASTFYISS